MWFHPQSEESQHLHWYYCTLRSEKSVHWFISIIIILMYVLSVDYRVWVDRWKWQHPLRFLGSISDTAADWRPWSQRWAHWGTTSVFHSLLFQTYILYLIHCSCGKHKNGNVSNSITHLSFTAVNLMSTLNSFHLKYLFCRSLWIFFLY